MIRAGPYNASRLNTTPVAVITSNTDLAATPGDVFVPATSLMHEVDRGLRRALGL